MLDLTAGRPLKSRSKQPSSYVTWITVISIRLDYWQMLYNFTVIYNGILLPKIGSFSSMRGQWIAGSLFPAYPKKKKRAWGQGSHPHPHPHPHNHTCMYMCMYIVHTGTYTSVYARTHVHVRVIERTAKRVRISSYIVHQCTPLLFTNQVHVRHSPMVVMIAHLLLGSVHSENSKLAFRLSALSLWQEFELFHVMAECVTWSHRGQGLGGTLL